MDAAIQQRFAGTPISSALEVRLLGNARVVTAGRGQVMDTQQRKQSSEVLPRTVEEVVNEQQERLQGV